MKIPKQIEIAGNTIKIKFKKKMKFCGLAHFDKNEIWLSYELKKNPDLMGVTFFHEIFHHILSVLNYHDLNEQEQLVDSVAQLLWQTNKQLDESKM